MAISKKRFIYHLMLNFDFFSYSFAFEGRIISIGTGSVMRDSRVWLIGYIKCCSDLCLFTMEGFWEQVSKSD